MKSGKRRIHTRTEYPLTLDLSDAVKCVFEGVEGAGASFGLPLSGQSNLELLQRPHQLLLGLDTSRLLTAAAAGG